MHRSIVALAIVAAFFIAPPSAVAQSGKGGGPKPKATAPTQSAPKASAGAKSVAPKSPKTTTATAPKGPKTLSASTSKGPKTTTVSAPKGPKSSGAAVTKSAKSTAPKTSAGTATAKNTKKTATPTTTTSPTPTTTPSDVTLTAVQQKLQKNTNLASKLQSRLPEGTNLMLAAEGFRNLGQFVAAVNVSNNLGIKFTDLKMKMVDDGMSLGQSIQALKPTSSATIEAQRAEYDARTIIYETEQAPTTTTTPTKSKKRPGGSQ